MNLIVKKPTEIPVKGNSAFEIAFNCSEWHFGLCKTLTGETTRELVIYDFNKEKWKFLKSGSCELLEYYIIN